MTHLEDLISRVNPTWELLLPGLVSAGLIAFAIAVVQRQRQKRSQPAPGTKPFSGNHIVQTCIETIKAEFCDRIPIVNTIVSTDYHGNQRCLEIWYLVETAAIEDSIGNDTRSALEERTREELLYLGYFRNRQDVVWTRVASEERLKQFGIVSYLRGDIGGGDK